MAGKALTDQSSMQCPHGATISATGTSSLKAAGGTVLTATDSFSIAGCPFQLPTTPPTPSPCVQVVWIVPDIFTRAGAPTLSESSVGLCFAATGLPQGPVVVVNTQQSLSTR
ncbi:MAG: hypothetical protein EA406_01300 [Rhodospirillales bacterium]|nr:MAG: hypothetical protein EA406_01300 [Rhodospirillales bacterium]